MSTRPLCAVIACLSEALKARLLVRQRLGSLHTNASGGIALGWSDAGTWESSLIDC